MLTYAVIGTGAIGGYYGGKLAHAGKEVHFLLHSDFSHVSSHGLKIDSVNGDFLLEKINAYSGSSSMPKCDIILVALKTTSNGILKKILPDITHENSIVILIQNGLGIEEDLSREIPGLSLAGGLAFICSNKIGPGHIAHLDQGSINIGAHDDTSQDILRLVCADFTDAGVKASLAPDLALARWQKLVWNIPFNGTTVVLRTTTGRIMRSPYMLALINEMMLEVIEGANACGVPVQRSFAEKMIKVTMDMPEYAPSMKLDWDNSRPLEIEYIYSRPVQSALRAGFDMKKVSMLEKQLRFLESERTKGPQ